MTATSADPDGSLNLARWVADRAATDPALPALKQGDQSLSYGELDALSARFARMLADAGVEPGDRVAMTFPNVLAFPVVYYAILRLGAVVVPMNPLLKAGEIAYAWADCGARVAVVLDAVADESRRAVEQGSGTELLVWDSAGQRPALESVDPLPGVARRRPDDLAVLLYTSGTTGKPKGAALTQANLTSNAITTVETLIRTGPGDVIFGGLPLFHSFGQTVGLNSAIYGGACLSLLPKFDGAEALAIMERDRVSTFLGVPTMYLGLLAVPESERKRYDTSALRTAVSGGASLPVEVLRAVEAAFGVTLLEGYGLSETSPVASFNHPDQPTRAGTIGLPIRGVEFGLRDDHDQEVAPGEVGEIVIRGENLMQGYWNRPDATAEAVVDGWFHTGDLAVRDEDGFYSIVDRKKDLIIRNGFNVYPREVEEILYAHPAVAEAAVLGIPDPVRGEEIAALVTLRPGAEADEDELQAYVRERIAAFKVPRIIRFGTIPKGPTGKILKREITIDR